MRTGTSGTVPFLITISELCMYPILAMPSGGALFFKSFDKVEERHLSLADYHVIHQARLERLFGKQGGMRAAEHQGDIGEAPEEFGYGDHLVNLGARDAVDPDADGCRRKAPLQLPEKILFKTLVDNLNIDPVL